MNDECVCVCLCEQVDDASVNNVTKMSTLANNNLE